MAKVVTLLPREWRETVAYTRLSRVSKTLSLTSKWTEEKWEKSYTVSKVLPHTAWLRTYLLQTTTRRGDFQRQKKSLCCNINHLGTTNKTSKFCVCWFVLIEDQKPKQIPLLKKWGEKSISSGFVISISALGNFRCWLLVAQATKERWSYLIVVVWEVIACIKSDLSHSYPWNLYFFKNTRTYEWIICFDPVIANAICF